MKSLDVAVRGVRKRAARKGPYDVRWLVSGRAFWDSFRTKVLAEHCRAKLRRAAREGEMFDTETAFPRSMGEKKLAELVGAPAATVRRKRRTS